MFRRSKPLKKLKIHHHTYSIDIHFRSLHDKKIIGILLIKRFYLDIMIEPSLQLRDTVC